MMYDIGGAFPSRYDRRMVGQSARSLTDLEDAKSVDQHVQEYLAKLSDLLLLVYFQPRRWICAFGHGNYHNKSGLFGIFSEETRENQRASWNETTRHPNKKAIWMTGSSDECHRYTMGIPSLYAADKL